MIDGEVIRLRRLRARALKARALAMAMDSMALDSAAARNLPLSRSAQACWMIAKVVTGVLRGHPNLSYQRAYNPLRAAYDRLSGGLLAAVAEHRGRTAQVFDEELWRVARELDDARALTWSTELSDTLGRSQLQMRGLLREWQAATALQPGSQAATSAVLQSRAGAGRHQPEAAGGTWPYLAL